MLQISKYQGYPIHKTVHDYLLVKVPGHYEKYNLNTHYLFIVRLPLILSWNHTHRKVPLSLKVLFSTVTSMPVKNKILLSLKIDLSFKKSSEDGNLLANKQHPAYLYWNTQPVTGEKNPANLKKHWNPLQKCSTKLGQAIFRLKQWFQQEYETLMWPD